VKALYVGYTADTENYGDEALQWIIRDLLAPEIEVVVSGNDFDIALLGGGTLINQSPWLIDHFASKLKQAGRGIVFGTGVGDLSFWEIILKIGCRCYGNATLSGFEVPNLWNYSNSMDLMMQNKLETHTLFSRRLWCADLYLCGWE
jgi:hypothetical protein